MVSHRQLDHALILAKAGNFTRASMFANLSQSAFSRSIRSLEKNLGAALFDRDVDQVRPTRYGEVVLRYAANIVADVDEMRREVQMMDDLQRGEISVGLGVYPAEVSANEALARLLRDYPGLRYRIFVSNWADIEQRVLSREVDIGYAAVEAVEPDERLEIHPVNGHRMLVFARKDHPLAGGRALSSEDLDDYPLVSIRVPSGLADQVPGKAAKEPGTGVLIPAMEIDDLGTARSIVAESDGIGVAVPVQIERELARGEFVILNVPEFQLAPVFSLIMLKSRSLSPGAVKFVEYVHSADAMAIVRNRMLVEKYSD